MIIPPTLLLSELATFGLLQALPLLVGTPPWSPGFLALSSTGPSFSASAQRALGDSYSSWAGRQLQFMGWETVHGLGDSSWAGRQL